MFLTISTPVPKDIPLPLPLPEWLLVTLLVVSFLMHIVFINLMIGGSLVALWSQWRGLKDKKYDQFAHEVAKTITVNKSLAVVLGVAPLLSINTLYTIYFYSANALTGLAWILIVPLVIIAFLLTYLHKFTWEKMEHSRRAHIGILLLAVGIFLFIPLIFLTNVNLMMFPDKWSYVKGFLSALTLPNVFPRYFEFLGACLSVTGVFLVWYNNRKNYPVEDIYGNDFSRSELKLKGYEIALTGIVLQVVFGLVVMVTLPVKGWGYDVIAAMLLAGLTLVIAGISAYKAITDDRHKMDVQFKPLLLSMLFFILFYGASRQMYRHNALHDHQELMALRTEEFSRLSEHAREEASKPKPPAPLDSTATPVQLGEEIFKTNCAACHQAEGKLVGPPITEMVQIYSGKETELMAWIKAPGKKRPDYPQMPGFPQFDETQLKNITAFILQAKP
jgi:cytochrome c